MTYKITIDGPSGTGKGYVAQEVSKKLGFLHLDTGAMYRAFTLYCKNNNINIDDEEGINSAIDKVKIDFIYEDNSVKTILNGANVSLDIRTEEIGILTSKFSALPKVRETMIKRQREYSVNNNIVVDGRDTGSVVFKDATLKIFLTASVEARAKRRYNELVLKGQSVVFEDVLEDIKKRDEMDLTRKISPLIKTEDMIKIDTTNLNKEQVVEKVLELVKQKGLGKC